LARTTAQQAKAEAEAGKMMLLITTAEVLKKAVESGTEAIADAAEDGVRTMDGCPNPGYTMNVNVVQRITITVPITPIPIQPINPIVPFNPDMP